MYTARDMNRIKHALHTKGCTLSEYALNSKVAVFDIMEFVRASEHCASCKAIDDCKYAGYETLVNDDGAIVMRKCKKYKEYRQRLLQILSQDRADIPPVYETMTFDTLDDTGNEATVTYGKDISQGVSQRGLYVFGNTGSGKTHLAIATLHKWLEKGTGLFATTPTVLNAIRGTFDDKVKNKELMDRLIGSDLLVLDDIGTEKWTSWTGEVLYEIINGRYINKKMTIFTSNMNPSELRGHMGQNGEKIVSRIFAMCYVRKMNGKDRRLNNE